MRWHRGGIEVASRWQCVAVRVAVSAPAHRRIGRTPTARGHARLGCTNSCPARRLEDARALASRRGRRRRAPACTEMQSHGDAITCNQTSKRACIHRDMHRDGTQMAPECTQRALRGHSERPLERQYNCPRCTRTSLKPCNHMQSHAITCNHMQSHANAPH